jgi:Neutral/alkaline non-lysosomal ceramidase, N-terminal
MKRTLLTALVLGVAGLPGRAADPAYKAGVATKVITPTEHMWMAGYAARNKPAEGKALDLYAKALAVEDDKGTCLILLTTDLIGLPKGIADAAAEKVMKETGLKREHLMLTASHTHSGPVLRENLADMYDLPPAEAAKVEAYSKKLSDDLAGIMIQAFRSRKPATLAIGAGEAKFAINRRQATDKGVVIGLNPSGPVDHSVPVLRVEADGKVLAVAFGYACHNTTLDYYKWSGDYAGYAQAEIEKAVPGTTALFWIGCGADANPNPRRKEENAIQHGKELAGAVAKALQGNLMPITGPFAAKYSTVSLPFDNMPTREQLQTATKSKSYAEKTRAERLLKLWDANGKIDDHYPAYPVQTWKLGDKLVWAALGGEVVIDYALRLKKELPLNGRTFWATGYANDVMAYIASARVIREGGYEVDSSMIYYGQPSRWKPAVEDIIVNEAVSQLKALDGK